MNTQDKSILAISDVIPLIQNSKVGYRNKLTLPSGQSIQLTRGLVRIAKLNQPLECCICGCVGTYLMKDYQQRDDGLMQEIWRVMSWNKQANKAVHFTVDHIVPKHYGGTLVQENMRIACHICNSQRGCSLENVELPTDIPVHREVYNIYNSLHYIRNKLKDLIQLTKEKASHFKNCVNKYLTAKSQSYRRTTKVDCFRDAIKHGLKQIGYVGLEPDIIDTIVKAGAVTL